MLNSRSVGPDTLCRKILCKQGVTNWEEWAAHLTTSTGTIIQPVANLKNQKLSYSNRTVRLDNCIRVGYSNSINAVVPWTMPSIDVRFTTCHVSEHTTPFAQ